VQWPEVFLDSLKRATANFLDVHPGGNTVTGEAPLTAQLAMSENM